MDNRTWFDQRPTHNPLTFEQRLRRSALELWQQADAALEAGDRDLWHEIMNAAALIEEYALLRESLASPLDDPRSESEIQQDVDWLDQRQTYASILP